VRDVRWLSVAHGAPIAFDEEGGGTGRLNLKGRGTWLVPTEGGGALVLWHNPLRTGGHWCSGVIKPGWRRIRKLRGGKELTQEENGEGVLDGFMLKQRVRRNGRIQPTVMKNGRGWPGGRQRVRIRGLVCRGRHRQRKEVPIGGPRWQRCGTLAHGTTHVVRTGKGFTGGTRRFK
jgi:hypothetical protein